MTAPKDERRLYTIEHAAFLLDVGRSTLWRLIDEGELTPVRHGALTRIRTEDLDALIDRWAAAGGATHADVPEPDPDPPRA